MLPFSEVEITAKRNRAFAIQTSELLLWQWIAMFTTKPDHYLNYYWSMSQADTSHAANKFSYQNLFTAPFNLTYDATIFNIIRNLTNKVYNIIFESGFILTPYQDVSTTNSLFLAENLEENSELKKQYDAVVQYLAQYAKNLIVLFNNKSFDGIYLLKEIIHHIIVFGNACFSIYKNEANQIKSRLIPINAIAIARNSDHDVTEFYYKRTMRYSDLVEKFGINSKILNHIISLKPNLTNQSQENTVTLIENSFYDIVNNVTRSNYVLEGGEEYFGYHETEGKLYEYISIERTVGKIYGSSLAYRYLPEIIFIQLLTCLVTKLSINEAVPQIIQFYEYGANNKNKIDTIASDGVFSQLFSEWNNLQNTFNNISNFDNDQLAYMSQIAASLGVNPLVPQKGNFSFTQSIDSINLDLIKRRQLLNISFFGDVVDQLNQNILGTQDLQSETYGEIQLRMRQSQQNFAPFIGNFAHIQENIFNNILLLSFSDILRTIVKYKTLPNNPKTNDEILEAARIYNSDVLFYYFLKEERESFMADLESFATESPYFDQIKEIDNLLKNIKNLQEEIDNEKLEEEKEKATEASKALQMHVDLLLRDVDEKHIFTQAKKKELQHLRDFRNDSINEFILFKALPPEILAYILDYLEKKGNLSKFLQVSFVSPELKRLKNLDRNVVMQTIADIGTVASIIPQSLEWLKPEFIQYITKTIVAPIGQDNVAVRSVKEFNQYQQEKQSYQEQLLKQGMKPEENIM